MKTIDWKWSSGQDVGPQTSSPEFNSQSDHSVIPSFNSSHVHTLVNSQLVSLPPNGILNKVMLDLKHSSHVHTLVNSQLVSLPPNGILNKVMLDLKHLFLYLKCIPINKEQC